MKFITTSLPGLMILKPRVFSDSRGFFMETYSRAVFMAQSLDCEFVQDNHARSEEAGVLRGFHFQLPPFAQAKLVRVVRGTVLDVVVDLRRGSPSFGRWYSVELSAENKLQLFVPRGFAHAYLTLTREAEFLYKVDNPYAPEHDAGLIWNDPDLAVDWPVTRPLLSEKDSRLPGWKGFQSPFDYAPNE
ncbi:MAG: dTDP-4-dehydrorhamnose 3,5-epimerase [Deltaproteobacteria bacterium]|nr:dTDP-4-dehydrorhamnose 3,5-epimerase [Deltaproteobacteria bacterium]